MMTTRTPMTPSALKPIFLVLACGLLALPTSALAEKSHGAPPGGNQSYVDYDPGSPLRSQMEGYFGALGSLWFNQDALVPGPFGIRGGTNVTESVAIDIDLRTVILAHIIGVGAKYYWVDKPLSPYAYGRAGALFLIFLPIGMTAHAGVGVEYVSQSGFTMSLEAGAVGIFATLNDNDKKDVLQDVIAGEINLWVGSRF